MFTKPDATPEVAAAVTAAIAATDARQAATATEREAYDALSAAAAATYGLHIGRRVKADGWLRTFEISSFEVEVYPAHGNDLHLQIRGYEVREDGTLSRDETHLGGPEHVTLIEAD